MPGSFAEPVGWAYARAMCLHALTRRAAALAVLSAVFVANPLLGQRIERIPESLLREVMPEAGRFADVAGDPPVVSAFTPASGGSEELLGYVFLTSDLPPEQYGYSGPIEALVGMRPDGTLTGMRVTDYNESYMRSMGDFLRTPGFQEQFAGKHIGDPFQLWNDIEGISRVSISVRALSRGVRDAARRVANAYSLIDGPAAATTDVVDPIGMSWFDLRQSGIVQRFEVTEPGEGSAGIGLAFIENDRLGAYFLGSQLYERAQRSAERRGGADNLMLYTIDGSRLRLFRQQGWSIEQDGDTTGIDSRNVVSMGLPSGGIVSGEATMVGIMLVDGSVDPSRPFRFVYDLGEFGVHTVEYLSLEARRAAAEAEAEAAAARAAEEARVAEVAAEAVEANVDAAAVERPPSDSPAEPEDEPTARETPEAESDSHEGADAVFEQEPSSAVDFVLTEDESLLDRTLSGASWGRLAVMTFIIALASLAFFTKLTPLRWASVTVTLVVLGWIDGGFLSVSHITSAIWAGTGVYLRDLPLLLIVTFALVTTLVWGRVFCGFLCPFGALQDVIDRVVPKSWKRPLPAHTHRRGVWVKYGILAVILLPALLGSQVSLYQYFEPFGTVFFLSPSLPLWLIAGGFLGASVVIPRFYCRYACPLGAALGILSLVSFRRIPRVEHCSLCSVCEQKCPTGAIRKEVIDVHECVRCNVCEVQLIEQRGVCGHDLEDVRPRLIQLEVQTGV
ncbi:MAG: 4Fe-4S binding protein [Gemmatimonadota bacterium]|nr:4Fe-4S binding protein [Gemmatimonadota bacterium]